MALPDKLANLVVGVSMWSIGFAIVLSPETLSATEPVILIRATTTVHHLFPGPRLWAASGLPHQSSILRGRTHLDMLELNKRYGNAVRISPTEVAFFSAEAFREIYGTRQGHATFAKDREHYVYPPNGVDNLVTTSDDATHARNRRLLGHAFSEKALREQKPLLQRYVDLLISRLRSQVKSYSEGKVNIKDWFNFITFDILGDLMFGRPFGCLEESTLHPWIGLLFNSLKAVCFLGVVNQFPLLKTLLEKLTPPSLDRQFHDHFNMAAERVDQRLEMKTDRPDVMSFAFRNGMREGDVTAAGEKEMTMSRAGMHSNAFIMIIAGSETSATALAGTIFYLCKNTQYLQRLRHEIRTAFQTPDEITISAVSKLQYLSAVIEESLRIYPPFVTSLTRKVPKGGDTVAGLYVPEDTVVACHLYASFHSPHNFVSPDTFIPDRWLNTDDRFSEDRKSVLNSFSLGPRGCLGKAYVPLISPSPSSSSSHPTSHI